jgi:hypothetical protein
MMCACDEAFGRRFLAHQIHAGRELETQIDVPVSLGFVADVCAECRGLTPIHAPLAEGFGRTSKIKRYYWRELQFREMQRQADWNDSHPTASPDEYTAAASAIEAQVLDEIKALHATSPKYIFSEVSQAEVLERNQVDVQAIYVAYSEQPAKGAVIRLGHDVVSPEAFVSRLYRDEGWSVLPLESLPLHALFGVMMWLLIQDSSDSQVRLAGFGDRHVYEATGGKSMIWTWLPDDFGGKGYSQRRKAQIERHLGEFPGDREGMLCLFDYWRPYSSDLRQYLWAHREQDVDRARQLVEMLSPAQIVSILRYLIDDYWDHYLGWPDLLLKRGDDILFIEVKSSSDRLSADQKHWIAGNYAQLKLPFRLVKLHRKRT